MRLKHLSSTELHLYQAIWTSTDSHTSPGKHREIFYRWNALSHRYLRAFASQTTDGAAWPPDER